MLEQVGDGMALAHAQHRCEGCGTEQRQLVGAIQAGIAEHHHVQRQKDHKHEQRQKCDEERRPAGWQIGHGAKVSGSSNRPSPYTM